MYPDVVAEAAETRAPQKVTTWVRDFARAFHGFYRDCRVLTDDAELTQARLWLTEACRIGLANALGLLGVHAPDEMARLDDDDERRARRRERAVRPVAAAARRRRVDERARSPSAGSTSPSWPSEFGTPLYVYDEAELRAPLPRVPRRVRRGVLRTRARRSSARRWRASSPKRASTSTSRPAASCTSPLHAGFPAERIVFHGNNKSTTSCATRCERGVGRIVVDSFDELDRLEALVAERVPAVRACRCA